MLKILILCQELKFWNEFLKFTLLLTMTCAYGVTVHEHILHMYCALYVQD